LAIEELVLRMRLLVLSKLFYPHGGGAELATWLYSKLLAEKGLEITVITQQFPGEPSAEMLLRRIAVFRMPMKVIGSRYDTLANIGIFAKSFVRKLIAKSDAVYIPADWYSAIPVAKLFKKPVVVHLHNYQMVCPTSLMYDFCSESSEASSLKSFIMHEKIEKERNGLSLAASASMNEFLGRRYNRLGAYADAVVFVSQAQMKIIQERIPTVKCKSHMIYNPMPEAPLIKAQRKGLGYFGGRTVAKGFGIMIEALASLTSVNNVEAYLTMVSNVHRKKKLNNSVSLNLLPRVNVLSIMEDLTTVAIPSLCPEPLPYVLIESMLHGKLIVASNTGGIPEIAGVGNSGVRLTPPGDSEAVADAIKSFWGLELNEANELGLKNREHLLKKLDNQKTVESFLHVLDNVTA
jgi:glycosyltransferase involved in cell wall biosynthesis